MLVSYATMKTLTLSGTVNVSIKVQGHDVELEDVDFIGTYYEEEPTGPTYGCGGTPGDVECNIELTDTTAVWEAVEAWFLEEDMPDVVIDSSIEDAVVEAITTKVLDDPTAYDSGM